MRLNYIIIPAITLATALLGGKLTGGGMSWYRTIKLPSWTPPGSVIGAVWTFLFILATISALLVWNGSAHDNRFGLIIAIFIVNAILNISWSWLFFSQHLLGSAIFEAILLGLSVIILIILIWPRSIWAGGLLVPYALWVAFASFLTYKVWSLN